MLSAAKMAIETKVSVSSGWRLHLLSVVFGILLGFGSVFYLTGKNKSQTPTAEKQKDFVSALSGPHRGSSLPRRKESSEGAPKGLPAQTLLAGADGLRRVGLISPCAAVTSV